MKREYHIDSLDGYQAIITDIFAQYGGTNKNKLVLALSGHLGAGKTTFVQVLAKQLGMTEPVTSPTFTIMKQYSLSGGDFDYLVHIDAYRLESESEAGPLRLSEILTMPRTIVCIEWPERIASYIPGTALRVLITIGDNECRQVLVEGENQ